MSGAQIGYPRFPVGLSVYPETSMFAVSAGRARGRELVLVRCSLELDMRRTNV
jgi:hypothetical protein